MALFNKIPNELILEIFEYSRPETIINFTNILHKQLDILSYMRRRANKHTGLKTEIYNLEQVSRICRLPKRSDIFTGNSQSFIIKKENIYFLGSALFEPETLLLILETKSIKNIIKVVS